MVVLSTLPWVGSAWAQGVAETPQATLSEGILAACSQDSTKFAKVLTERNREAFARMTQAARTTFLKRFVLLDKAGQAQPENVTQANEVRLLCTTPDVTVEIRIGKPEIRDNLAFLPFEIRDSTDSSGVNSHKATIGLVKEAGQWKLLSLGLLLLDLPSLEEEWDRAESQANEKLAIATMQELVDAIEKYRQTYTRLPDTLQALGPTKGGAAKADAAGLVSEELASGKKDGYTFRYVIVGASASGAPAQYQLAATPSEYGRTGTRSFFRDANGVMHAADRQGAVGSAVDPKLE